MWLVFSAVDTIASEHFHYPRKFFQKCCFQLFVFHFSSSIQWLVCNLFMITFDKIKFLILTESKLLTFYFIIAAFWQFQRLKKSFQSRDGDNFLYDFHMKTYHKLELIFVSNVLCLTHAKKLGQHHDLQCCLYHKPGLPHAHLCLSSLFCSVHPAIHLCTKSRCLTDE